MSSCLNESKPTTSAAHAPVVPGQLHNCERLLQGVAASTHVLLTSLNYRRSIDQALAILGEATQVDRIYIFETHVHPVAKEPAMSQRWEWASPNVTPEINNPDLQNLLFSECFPRWYEELSNRRPIFGPVHTFPLEEREILEPQGILSILIVPIMIQERFWGLVGFDKCQSVYEWSEVEISTLWAIAGSFGGTIARHRAETALQKLNQTLEVRVEERTEELTATNEELSTTIKSLRATQSQLIHAEKMSSLGQLVAGIAHEINNPANFIHGNLKHAQRYTEDLIDLIELYQSEYPNPSDKLEEALAEIEFDFLKEDFSSLMSSVREGVARIAYVVRSLRNFSRLDEAECKQVDLHHGIDSALNFLQHRLKPNHNAPGITVSKSFDDKLPMIECFSGSLNQAVMSILTNAIDALEEKTRTQQSQRPNKIEITTAIALDNQVMIRIADNANGMDKAFQQKIFDPFVTSKPVGKGTGLGLSIAYQIIVQDHQGDLVCYSIPGQGTTFEIRLPLKQNL